MIIAFNFKETDDRFKHISGYIQPFHLHPSKSCETISLKYLLMLGFSQTIRTLVQIDDFFAFYIFYITILHSGFHDRLRGKTDVRAACLSAKSLYTHTHTHTQDINSLSGGGAEPGRRIGSPPPFGIYIFRISVLTLLISIHHTLL